MKRVNRLKLNGPENDYFAVTFNGVEGCVVVGHMEIRNCRWCRVKSAHKSQDMYESFEMMNEIWTGCITCKAHALTSAFPLYLEMSFVMN